MKNYGYIEPEIKEEDFILGGGKLPDENLRPDGQWLDVLPSNESQAKRGVDVFNCTAFGWLNVIEMYFRAKFFLETNNSDRYTGISAGTYPPGNDPSTVIESIRTTAGLITEELLPFIEGMTVGEYYSPKPLPVKYTNKGKDWLKKYYLRHEWVFKDSASEDEKKIALMEALKHSPVAIAVNAWNEENGMYVRKGSDTHWTCLAGFKLNDFWFIFDSYKPYIKKLDWNFGFQRAKRFYIGVQEESKQKEDYLTYLIEYVQLAVFSFQEAILRFFAPKKAEIVNTSPEEVKSITTQPSLPVNSDITKPIFPTVKDWALVIKTMEGWYEIPPSRSFRNKSPGNIRYNEFIKNVLRSTGQDEKGFAKWNTYEDGLNALIKFLTLAIQDKLISYHPGMTIYEFYQKYAPSTDKNNPLQYAQFVAKKLNLTVNTKIKEINLI